MTKQELEILREELVRTRASIRLNSYGLIISTLGLGTFMYYYVHDDKSIVPVIAFAGLTTLSALKETKAFSKELDLRRKINDEEKKLSLTK